MTRWFFLISLLVALGGAGLYAYLGGFRSAEVEATATAQPIYLAGRYFRGPAQSPDFGPLFRQAHQLRESGQLRGELANIYYNDPAAATDTVRAFVGLAVADTTSQQLPSGYRYRTFPAGRRVLRAQVQASYLIAPDKLYRGIKRYADKNKIKLRQEYLEVFPEKRPAEVLAVVE